MSEAVRVFESQDFSRRIDPATLTINAPRYAFTFFRDLDIKFARASRTKLNRCELTYFENHPIATIDHAAMVDIGSKNGQPIWREEWIPAGLQTATLTQSYGQEGLLVFDPGALSPHEARELYELGQDIKDKTIDEAVNYLIAKPQVKGSADLISCLNRTRSYCNAVLAVTRQEIAKARSGRGGKSFLDENDTRACDLLGLNYRSILAEDGGKSEGAVGELANAVRTLVDDRRRAEETIARSEIEEMRAQIAQLTDALLSKEAAVSKEPVTGQRSSKKNSADSE